MCVVEPPGQPSTSSLDNVFLSDPLDNSRSVAMNEQHLLAHHPDHSRQSRLHRAPATALVLLLAAAVVPAQDTAAPASSGADAEGPQSSFYEETTVTATGVEADTFQLATPVVVLDADTIEERQPDNATDLLRAEPGVDVNGVGPNQARPIIRGQRGLRVLFLEDGLRMNNPRRQTDFGEITGLVDVNQLSSVEVVRGPASVLYGSDAIGGVLNLVTRSPASGVAGWQASLGLRAGSAGDQSKVDLGLGRSSDTVSFSLLGSVREADDYEAASGTFGDITLENETPVLDTGIEDDAASGSLVYQLGDSHSLRLRHNRYRADQTGFGLVEPELLGGGDPTRVRILYPFQDFDRTVLGYEGVALESAIADSVELKLYRQTNERELRNDIFIDIGPAFGPGPSSDVTADTLNFTDLDTVGLRAQLGKTTGDRGLLTYGLEIVDDDSSNTDFSVITTTLRAAFPLTFICGPAGAIPPFSCVFEDTDSVANAPNASNRHLGLFAQQEWLVTSKLTLTGGLRYAQTETAAEPTPGWDITGLDFDDDAVVGSLGAVYSVHPNVNLVASYGTAFRAPNIVERLFNGITPEGIGFQLLNPDLESEHSDNIDLGIKFRNRRAFVEAFYFDSEIDDAIIQFTLTPSDIAALPPDVQQEISQSGVSFVVQQRNADVLKIDGFELAGGYRFDSGFSVGGNYTRIDGESVNGGPAADPTGETFSEKLNLSARWDPSSSRYWIEYRLRYNGEEDIFIDPNAFPGPIGTVLPSFTVHTLAAGVRLFEGARHTQHTQRRPRQCVGRALLRVHQRVVLQTAAEARCDRVVSSAAARDASVWRICADDSGWRIQTLRETRLHDELRPHLAALPAHRHYGAVGRSSWSCSSTGTALAAGTSISSGGRSVCSPTVWAHRSKAGSRWPATRFSPPSSGMWPEPFSAAIRWHRERCSCCSSGEPPGF